MFLWRILMMTLCLMLLAVGIVNASEKVEDEEKPRIGIFLFRQTDPYISLVSKSIENSLDGQAIYAVFDAQQDRVMQVEQLDHYLSGQVDALAINLVDVKMAQSILNMVSKKNIPVIFFNKEPDPDITKSYGLARYVGTNAAQSGLIQGEMVARVWNDNPKFDRNNDGVCNFIMLQGNIDNPEALLRSKTVVQRARSHGVKMQQIGDTLICDWDELCAYNSVKLAFSVDGDEVDFIIANNDAMALGAISALNEYGFNTNRDNIIPVFGIDAIERAKKSIDDGIMQGTVIQDANSMGSVVAKMLLNIIDKKAFMDGLNYELDKDGVSVRIPYKSYD